MLDDRRGGRNWIRFEGRSYEVGEGRSALEAMLAGGANLEFSCRRGVCRCCMLEAVSGDPGEAARSRLPEVMTSRGAFLPCMATDPVEVEARRPDRAKYLTRAVLHAREAIGPEVFRLRLETETVLDWRAGQTVAIRSPGGDFRSYSIVSRPEDYFLEIHVRHYPGGALSPWLCGELGLGEVLELAGPSGYCHHRKSDPDRPLLLVGTGVGAGVLTGIARDALESGCTAPVTLALGTRTAADRLLLEETAELSAAHPNLRVLRPTSREGERLRVTDVVFGGEADLSEHRIFLCGAPEMVEAGRIAAVRQGAELGRIHADPFDPPEPYRPRDGDKISAIAPEPEIWAALDNGRMLTELLTVFYTRVFADPRLAPFFQKATKQRLIEKQYAFLRDLFSGTSEYFGERPFNSHHWMIISDELFDYREEMFFEEVRKTGFPEQLIPRWRAVHEIFRREIVKNSMRGQYLDGVEIDREGYDEEPAPMAMVCDGCGGEIAEGERVRTHRRTGALYCSGCAGL